MTKMYKDSKHEIDSLYSTLKNEKLEINAINIGSNLRGIWTFSSHSKNDFANLLGIDSLQIDDYFEGRKLPTLEILIRASKIFDFQIHLFFLPSYYGFKAFWNTDLIKFLLLRITTPKNRIATIIQDNEFYFNIFNDYSYRLIDLKETIESHNYKGRQLSPDFINELRCQYYKLLEQIDNRNLIDDSDSDETPNIYTPNEKILKRWFFVNEDYIARLIVEGIRQIRIVENNKIEIIYSFIEDIEDNSVISMGYDSLNYEMKSRNI